MWGDLNAASRTSWSPILSWAALKKPGTALPLRPDKIIAGKSCDRASHDRSVAYGWKLLFLIRRPNHHPRSVSCLSEQFLSGELSRFRYNSLSPNKCCYCIVES